MKRYDVTLTITLEAPSLEDAIEQAADLVDRGDDQSILSVSIEDSSQEVPA